MTDEINFFKKELKEALGEFKEYQDLSYIKLDLKDIQYLKTAINKLLNVNAKYDLVSCLDNVEVTKKNKSKKKFKKREWTKVNNENFLN